MKPLQELNPKWLLPLVLVVSLAGLLVWGILSIEKDTIDSTGLSNQSSRSAGYAFLSPASQNAALWALKTTQNGSPQRLSPEGQAVSSFSVSPNGEQLVFSVKNSLAGVDLWLVNRSGTLPKLLLECVSDSCQDPAWSPDGRTIAYSRLNSIKDNQSALERIWLLDLTRNTSAPLFEDPSIFGIMPVWSPDGSLLALVDLTEGGIRIVNVSSRDNRLIQARQPALGGWSSDNKSLYYADLDSGALPSLGRAYILKLDGWELKPLFSKGPQQVDYAAPAPSPDGQWLAVGLRFSGASRQLWLLSEDGDRQLVIDEDPQLSHGISRWSPDGSQLLYQRLALGSSQSVPEIWVWDRPSRQSFLAARNAFTPQWLP